MSAPVAIIAGAGRFPFHVAQAARAQGVAVVGLGLRGWADPALAAQVEAYEEVAVGQLGQLLERLKARSVQQAIMAGKVTKAVLMDEAEAFDGEALGILHEVREYSVPSLLGAIAARLARDGITLLDSSTFLKDHLCPVGPLTTRGPSADDVEAIRVGIAAARQLAGLDVGQTVVVKGRVLVAVEALEGTDATIRRAQALAGGGCVVVKMASPSHDRRFDLPVIGLQTIALLRDTGASCLAVEAGMTLLLDREPLIASANDAGLCIVGVPQTHPPQS